MVFIHDARLDLEAQGSFELVDDEEYSAWRSLCDWFEIFELLRSLVGLIWLALSGCICCPCLCFAKERLAVVEEAADA